MESAFPTPAPIWKRICAFIIDTICIHICQLIVGAVIYFFTTIVLLLVIPIFSGGESFPIAIAVTIISIFFIFFLIGSIAPNFILQWQDNQTLGQIILRIRVQTTNNQKHLTFSQTAIRTIFILPIQFLLLGLILINSVIVTDIAILGIVIVILGLDLVWYFANGKQTLHDHLSQTTVVNTSTKKTENTV